MGGVAGWWIRSKPRRVHTRISETVRSMKHPGNVPAPEDKSRCHPTNCPVGWNLHIFRLPTVQGSAVLKRPVARWSPQDQLAGLDGSILQPHSKRRSGLAVLLGGPTGLSRKYEWSKLSLFRRARNDKKEWDAPVPRSGFAANPKVNYYHVSDVFTADQRHSLTRRRCHGLPEGPQVGQRQGWQGSRWMTANQHQRRRRQVIPEDLSDFWSQVGFPPT